MHIIFQYRRNCPDYGNTVTAKHTHVICVSDVCLVDNFSCGISNQVRDQGHGPKSQNCVDPFYEKYVSVQIFYFYFYFKFYNPKRNWGTGLANAAH